MKNKTGVFLISLSLFFLTPSLCSADMVAPLTFVFEGVFYGVFSGIIFFLIIWIAEAYSVKIRLGDNTKKPLEVSLVGNAITTLLGIIYFILLSYFVIPSLGVYLGELGGVISFFFLVLIVPFYITFYTELCVLKKYYRTYQHKKLRRVSLCMNTKTYTLFLFFMVATINEIGVLMWITPVLSYYLVRLFEMYSSGKNLKKYRRCICSTLIVVLTIIIMVMITIGPLAPPRKYDKRYDRYDTHIKHTLKNIRADVELYYDNNSNSYKEVCSNSKIVKETEQTIVQQYKTSYLCQNDDQKYCISAKLPTSAENPTEYFCIDSQGNATTTLHNYCADGNYSCLN